jgi:type VI secretion system protein VasG
MSVADQRRLFMQLTPCTRVILEEAAQRCHDAGHGEVLPEHLLLAALDREDSDLSLMLANTRNPRAAFGDACQGVLQRMPRGREGLPVFSQRLLRTLDDALVIGLTHLGLVGIRSGTILIALMRRPGEQSAGLADALQPLERHGVLDDFERLTLGSAEIVSARIGSPPTNGDGATDEEPLRRFTRDLREAARSGEIDPVFGRETELEQLVVVLCRRRKNNPVIVGEPGVGKTALVEGLALAMERGEVPPELANVSLRELDLGGLRAGASVKGELERRLKGLIDAVKRADPPIILFVDEIHTVLGAGGGGGDRTADLLKPALARGGLRMIGATTHREYKRDFEKDAALARRFEPITVEEPDDEHTGMILRGVRDAYESRHGIPILDRAIEAAVSLSNRYLAGRRQPDKSIDLLDGAAAYARLRRVAPPLELRRLEARYESVVRRRDALRRDRSLGHEVEADRIEVLDRSAAELEEMIGRAREEWEARRRMIDAFDAARAGGDPQAVLDARAALEQALEGDHPHDVVDEVSVADVISRRTGVPAGRVLAGRAATAAGLVEELRRSVVGQDHAVVAVADGVRSAMAGVNDPDGPTAVFLCVGPSGIGKTQLARSLAARVFGGERFLVNINMGEFQESHTVSRLIGSPPGYVGYGEGGQLTEAVRQRPHSLVLLDEVEKAHPDVLGAFYDLFDRGRLNDGEGIPVDFRNTVIMLTSNLGSDIIEEACRDGRRPDPDTIEEAIRPSLEGFFRKALLARIHVVPFLPLEPHSLARIVDLRLERLAARLRERHDATLHVDDAVRDWLADRASHASGVRAIESALRRRVLPSIATAVLETMSGGDRLAEVRLGLQNDGPVVRTRTMGDVEEKIDASDGGVNGHV